MNIDYLGMGNRIRLARKGQRMTQTELARLAGISISFLGHVERGTRKASVETLATLCEVLDMDLHYMVLGSRSSSGRELLMIWQSICAIEKDMRAMLSR